MSLNKKIKVETLTIVAAVAVLTLVFGIMLDDQVVPESKQPLMTEQSTEPEQAKTPEEKKELVEKRKAAAEKKRQAASSEIEELNQRADTTIEKAEGLITKTDELIAKAGLKTPEGSKTANTKNQGISRRLAKARGKLDSLKQ